MLDKIISIVKNADKIPHSIKIEHRVSIKLITNEGLTHQPYHRYLIEKNSMRYQDDMKNILESEEIVKRYLTF